MNTTVSECCTHPVRVLNKLEIQNLTWSRIPLRTWAILVVFIVLSSGIYGASLSLNCAWQATNGALWLILSAGLSWCIFGPALVFATRKNMFLLAHACLVTMLYGEWTLLFSALINVVLWKFAHSIIIDYVVLNCICVGISNVVMATALARQLKGIDVPIWKTLVIWMVVLNGCGAFLFYVFYQILSR